jgi:hypothetical protein
MRLSAAEAIVPCQTGPGAPTDNCLPFSIVSTDHNVSSVVCWQMQPYCNVVTLNVTQNGGVYALDGFEQRDKLREELTVAELELSEARVEQFDIDSALAKAISVLNNASALWIDASLEDRLRLQEVLFPQGL